MTVSLTPHQKDAALAWDQHALVSAGAGSGKTRTVVARILYLLGVEIEGATIDKPLDLHRIAAITFTNKAAADLKLQLRKALRAADRHDDAYRVDTARVGTIHAFCGDVLREFGLRRGKNPTPRVLDEGEGLAITIEVVRDTLLDALDRGTVPGLTDLLAEQSPSQVRGMVETLVAESDRLRAFAARRDEHEPNELALINLSLETLKALETRLNEDGVVDFDRMITWTRDLLKEDEYARNALQRRVHTLIVDEFQDVDPAQRDIAYLLGEPASGRTDTTRLMLVGDAKQSIYRFRRADVSVWRKVEREFKALPNAAVMALPQNFRSKEPIIGFVEATVGKLMDAPLAGEEHADFEVPFEQLRVGNEKEQAEGPPVEVIVIPTKVDGKDYSYPQIRRMDAQAVARRARELVDEGHRWGDIAVLLAGWGAVDVYQKALEEAGAPTYVIRMEGFYERQEVIDLIVALETIHQPLDDRTLMGYLRGPFVGLKDESLFAIAESVRGTSYWRWLQAGEGLDLMAPDERVRAERGIAVLKRHIAMRDRVATDVLLQSLLEETGYVAHLALMGDDHAQAIANVRKFVRNARGMRARGLGDFLQVITDTRDHKERVGNAPLYGQRDDVVTITSIHSAKGLEWPIVFWCDTVRGAQRSASDPLRGHDRIVLRDRDIPKPEDERQHWRDLKQEIDLQEDAEDRRKWYVAMTRAEERLIIAGLPLGQRENPRSSPAGALWSVLPPFDAEDGATFTYDGQGGREHTGVVRMADPEAAGIGDETEAAPTREPVAEVDTLVAPKPMLPIVAGNPRHSASEMLAFERCAKRHWFKYIMGLREPPVDWQSNELIDAITRGLIVHDVLERLEEERELDALLEDAIGRWDEDAPPPETPKGTKYRVHLHEEVESVASHAEYRAIADLPSAKRELGFLHIADAEHFYQGKIDLAALEETGYALLDVKTSQGDAAASKKKAEQYAPQRDVYVASAEGISGRDVGRFAFQFSRAEAQVSETIGDDVRQQINTSLAARLETMSDDAPAMTEHPWECRWCGYKEVGWCEGVR